MKNDIGKAENMKLINTIVLNGKVGWVFTDDDNYQTIGILDLNNEFNRRKKRPEEVKDIGYGFPLTKEVEDEIGWGKYYASVWFVTSNRTINPDKINENRLLSYYGLLEAEYEHIYTDLTGYIYTREGFVVGGHNLLSILMNNMDKYIHLVIELYQEKD